MDNLNSITGFFSQIWQLMSINHPVIGVPFSIIYLGAFAVGFGITILRPLLGIGAGAVGDISKSARRVRMRNLERKNYNKRNKEAKGE